MSFECTRDFTITVNAATAADMPLDQAIYVASTDKIYGVRGQWVYQFNATTAALEKTFKFSYAFFQESSIIQIGTFLYIGTWRTICNPLGTTTTDIFKVDLSLTTSTPIGVATLASLFAGWTNLCTDGTILYGVAGPPGTTVSVKNHVFKVNPTNVAATYKERTVLGYGFEGFPISDAVFDSTNKVLWVVDPGGPQINGVYYDIASLFPVPADVLPSTPSQLFGITKTSGTIIYGAMLNRSVLRVDISSAVASLPANFSNATQSTLTNILAVGATPMKIKYNPNDGLIYVPEWNNDTVEIINPVTDLVVSTKTGFTAPFDCVFTPTKKFAVQNSSVGLKEIV